MDRVLPETLNDHISDFESIQNAVKHLRLERVNGYFFVTKQEFYG